MENMRISMRNKGMRKKPVCRTLKVLLEQMEREGYVPDTKEVLHELMRSRRDTYCVVIAKGVL